MVELEADFMTALKISYLEGYRDGLVMANQLLDMSKSALNVELVQSKIDKLKKHEAPPIK